MTGTLLHGAGHSRAASIPLALDASGGKNNLQGMGSTFRYGKRYTAVMLLNLVFEGEDDDGVRGGMVFLDEAQRQQVTTLLRETKANLDGFLEFMGATSSAEGTTHRVRAIDRVSKFVRAEFHATAEMAASGAFMRGVVAAFPCQIHTVPTDNGVASTKDAPTQWDGMRDRVCDEHGIEHRRTLPCHPWTNGPAERMNRTVKDAIPKAFHYETTQALCAHVLALAAACNLAKHLDTVRWRTPFQAICGAWKAGPAAFKVSPHHLTSGLCT